MSSPVLGTQLSLRNFQNKIQWCDTMLSMAFKETWRLFISCQTVWEAHRAQKSPGPFSPLCMITRRHCKPPGGVWAHRPQHLECNVRRSFVEATLCRVVPSSRVKTWKIGWSQPRVRLQIRCFMCSADKYIITEVCDLVWKPGPDRITQGERLPCKHTSPRALLFIKTTWMDSSFLPLKRFLN